MGRVIVDTSVWSLAFRRVATATLSARELRARQELADRIMADESILIGVVRQEVLTGLRPEARFNLVRERLAVQADERCFAFDHERAAQMWNTCRANGVLGSPADFLICAVSERLEAPIFTMDSDFAAYARHIPVALHEF